MSTFLKKIFGDPNKKTLRRIFPEVEKITALRETYRLMNDEELRLLGPKWSEEIRLGTKTLDDCLPDFFSASREVALRVRGSGHFDVQFVGGMVLHEGAIAELKTGEGKTSFIAPLAAGLNALEKKGVHVVTVNDYLSRRDAGWGGPLLHGLGLSVGVIVHDHAYIFDPDYKDPSGDKYTQHLREVSRKEAYAADITFGTNNEFGFDYLRDNMVQRLDQKVQRELHYAIIDECDSILIDEARTPLIISAPAEESADLYYKFADLVQKLVENEDYNVDEKMRSAILTEAGISKMEDWLGMGNIYTEGGITLVHHIEQALKAHTLFRLDRDYVVRDGENGSEVVIIDEFTGRMMQGRRYSEGLHQAIEAKERVSIQRESRTLATITFQNYFRMYHKISGMTGTAETEEEEFQKIYNLNVVVVPTNKPLVRNDKPDRIYRSEEGKFEAVIREVRARQEKGQPVLVGTISIEKNERLSELFKKSEIRHNVLNAKFHESEAHVIAEAGKSGFVTLATNMAGRGVDIILGGTPPEKENFSSEEEYENAKVDWQREHDKVIALGGLAVIGTERHEARRIDNQLRGRSGRQGDAGESQFYVSMDDDLMRVFGSDRLKRIMTTLKMPEDVPIENKLVSRSIEQAQKRVEGNNFDTRRHLVQYDDVMNKHRSTIYRKRNEILDIYDRELLSSRTNDETLSLRSRILEMVNNEIEQVVSFHTSGEDEQHWDLKEIYEVAHSIFPVPENLRKELNDIRSSRGENTPSVVEARTIIIEHLETIAHEAYEKLAQSIEEESGSPHAMLELEKSLLLNTFDSLWIEHLEAMNYLRTGIGLQGYGQRDPLVEYKREGYRLFVELNNLIEKQVVATIYKLAHARSIASSLPGRALQLHGAEKEMTRGGSSITREMNREIESRENHVAPKPRAEDGHKLGRNDPCFCASGKKYKKCHGA